jgi:hypothetical protein
MHKLYIYKAPFTYKAIYQMHWDSKQLLNCPPQDRPLFYYRSLIRGGLLYCITYCTFFSLIQALIQYLYNM